MSKKRLGRGLDALLSERATTKEQAPASPPARDETVQPAASGLAITQIALTDLVPSPYQPRRTFDEEAMAELARSIRQRGVLQPIVVRERASGGYELIAGERRWRASELAGLSTIPAVVRVVTDAEASAFALIENIQREDLSVMEEALGLARLRDEFQLTQQEIADAVGKSRVAIANLLRLLNLGSVARQLLESGKLEMGHARALLALEGVTQDRAAEEVARGGLSVRQTEALVRSRLAPKTQKPVKSQAVDPEAQRLARRLTDFVGAPVNIKHEKGGAGSVTIKYHTLEELDGVLDRIGLPKE